jgi:hypothetical protein
MATIGLLVGRENTFPQPFIDTINGRNIPGISAELVKLGGTALDEELPYRVLVDRISHEVPYYRCYLKSAALQGAVVINDPFWWGSDDKFLESQIARRVGVAVPKTLLVPNKEYVEGITGESLRNLRATLDWEAMLDYVGRPAILKPAIGGGWKNVYKVNDAAELVRCFNESGQLQMILQEFIQFEQYVRCICLGREHIKVLHYDPARPFHERYVMDDNDGYLSPELYQRVEGDARKLVQALGYDMDTVEFAIRDGIPYAIDFLNPAPDFDDFSIKQQNFAWVLDTMTDLVIAYAQGKAEAPRGYIWQENPFRPTPPASPFAVASGVPTAPTGAPATPAVASPPASPTTTTTVESKPRGRAKGSKASSAAPISRGGDGIPEESGAPAAAPKRRRGKTE